MSIARCQNQILSNRESDLNIGVQDKMSQALFPRPPLQRKNIYPKIDYLIGKVFLRLELEEHMIFWSMNYLSLTSRLNREDPSKRRFRPTSYPNCRDRSYNNKANGPYKWTELEMLKDVEPK